MLDLALVLAFVAYAISSGLRARRRASEGLEQYFLAGRSIAGWRAGISMAATQFAADTPLLVTGLIATAGVWAVWRLWVYGLAFLLMAFVLAGPWRRARVITDAELTEVRYGGRGVLALRVLKGSVLWLVIGIALLVLYPIAGADAAALLGPPNDPAVTASFYHRVRPAGWWGRAAAANGEPPTAPRRRLGRQLGVTAAAAGSLFLALVGFGRLALPAAASWPLVPVVSLVGAAVLAPVWLHSLRDEDAAEVA